MQIALLIALLLGGGTSIAAQNALPGDMLYSVKVNGDMDVNLNTGTETQTGTSSTGVKTNGGIKVDLGL